MSKSFLFLIAGFLLTIAAHAENDNKYDVKPSGEVLLSGVVETTSKPGLYSIAGHEFKFAPGKLVNGFGFDKDSVAHFIGRDVEAHAKRTPRGLVVTALIPTNLYSARSFVMSTLAERNFHSSLSGEQTKFAKLLVKSAFQSPISYRTTLRASRQVKPGERALIVTFSGSQGDDASSAMGHFAFGQALVRPNGDLDAEISNFYPVMNEKQITPGHTSVIDYFGHTVSGQNQYRPTFTLIIYGVSADALSRSRAYMDGVFGYLNANRHFSVTNNFNCTTETANAIQTAKLDVMGRSESLKFMLHDRIARLMGLEEHTKLSTGQSIAYFFFKDNARFLPRRAFERVLENVMSTGEISGEKVARLDYIFQGQIPSARPRGFLAASSVIEYIDVKPYFALRSLSRSLND